MTHGEQRVWMIQELFDEDPYYKNYRIPAREQEQKDLLRSLMNVREPKPISPEFLKIQDEYLTEENSRGGITNVDDLKPSKLDQRMILWQGDITALKVDAIVNAANSGMCGCFRAMHNCVDNIIHSKSGIQLRLKCSDIMRAQGHEEPTGQAKITPAYNLPCEYVLHTVGPIVDGRLTKRHEELLASCYRSCLELAEENGVESIAFCCISTGVFMFPNDKAAEIAVRTVKEYLDSHAGIKKVVFNVFKDVDLEIYEKILMR
jgi:O-acetyl-ADP-ribose deacetylase (regulator of RNase III)